MDKLTHYQPNAAVFFVPAFEGEVIKEIVNVQYSTDVKEMSSINLMLTIKNNPGTFSMTIVDTDNRYVIQDNADDDIKALFSYSQGKLVEQDQVDTITRKRTTPKGTGSIDRSVVTKTGTNSNFYQYQTYGNWLDETHVIIIDPMTNRRYPTQFIKDKTGKIKQRWAFDELGNILLVTDSIVDEESLQQDLVMGGGSISSYEIPVIDLNNNKKVVSYFIEGHKNRELTEGRFRDREEQGNQFGVFKKGKCKISPMDRVVIYMSPRFDPATYKKTEGGSSTLVRAFTGVVNNVQQEYSENKNLITVTGEDVTKYLKISIINVNPGLDIDTSRDVNQQPDENLTVWNNILQGLTTPDIIRMLCFGSDLAKLKTEALSYAVSGIWSYKLAQTGNQPNLVYDVKANAFVPLYGPQPQSNKKIRTADYSAMMGYIFGDSSVHIIDPYRRPSSPLTGFRPYELSFKTAYSFYQADFKTRRDIAYQCAEDSNFNFYADRFGDIWFRPQRFDISWLLGAANPDLYIINNADIVSYGLIESDENIYTSVNVTTEPDLGMEQLGTFGQYYATFRDDCAVLKYGQRMFVCSNPVINTKMSAGYTWAANSSTQNDALDEPKRTMLLYAKSLLQRILASKYQGQITIGLRAEMEPGNLIYIPIRNMLYLVETVQHDVNFGGSSTTTLHLSYGRKPWELLPELLTYSSNDEVFMTDASVISRYTGMINPQKTNNNMNNNSVIKGVTRVNPDGRTALIAQAQSVYNKYKDIADKYSAPTFAKTTPKQNPNVTFRDILALICCEGGTWIVQDKPVPVSSAGAIGPIQIKPATAQDSAKDMGLTYRDGDLTDGDEFDIKYGSHYFQMCYTQAVSEGSSDPSVLAAGRYHAGIQNENVNTNYQYNYTYFRDLFVNVVTKKT